MLTRSDNAQVVLIDIQQRLAAAMPKTVHDRVIHEVKTLLTACDVLKVPVLITEQYPQGLGRTMPFITERLPDVVPIEKTSFSCVDAPGFIEALEASGRKQVIIAGMETHICVLQTAIQLKQRGFSVYVLEEGVCSRIKAHQTNGIDRMRAQGISITNIESVLFEWLQDAKHPEFKTLATLIL